jgi:Mu transposase-like protein
MGTPRRVTPAQVKELWRQLAQGRSLRTAAMRANMDRKSARKYRNLGQLPAEARKPRTWRTRPDPLADVWPAVAEQLQQEPRLQAKTLWQWVQQTQPGQCPESARRTLERRVRQWKAQHGPAKEVFFTQVHAPGRLAASDFTSMNDLQVTIAGEPLPHLLYHFVLTHSNWEHVTLCFSESFTSLSAGLQNALWVLGGVPQRHRTDRMTLAVHHDGQPEQFTANYRALLAHYGLAAEATNPASGHENGDVESSHRHFKEALEQALLLRGSRDFSSREDYVALLQTVQSQRNAGWAAAVAAEVAELRPLPAGRLESLERLRVRVSRTSTIRVKHNTYSVPARLIGEEVEARLGLEEIDVWYAQELVQRMPRLRGQDKHWIDYRHIIGWLVRKPGAFARYVYREELYPTLTYRRAYDALVAQQPARADKEYVRLLYLASVEGEARVEAALAKLLGQRQLVNEQAVRTLLGAATPLAAAIAVSVPAVDLCAYDALLQGDYQGTGDQGRSLLGGGMEENHERGEVGSVAEVPAGPAPADGAVAVRGGGAASDGRGLELCRVPPRAAGAGVPAAAAEPGGAAAEGVALAVGEELGVVGCETSAWQSSAAIARAVEWGLCGSPREHFSVWPARHGEDARPVCGGPGTGALGPAVFVHNDGAAGAGIIGGQARLDPEDVVETSEPVGSINPGRLGLRAADAGGDGGVVHAAVGALRTGQCVPDEQPAVLEVGGDLQGRDDGGGGHRPASAPQRDRGVERSELSRGSGQATEVQPELTAEASAVGEALRRGPGSVAVAVTALRLPPLRQAPAAVQSVGSRCPLMMLPNSLTQPQRAGGWARRGER